MKELLFLGYTCGSTWDKAVYNLLWNGLVKTVIIQIVLIRRFVEGSREREREIDKVYVENAIGENLDEVYTGIHHTIFVNFSRSLKRFQNK